MHHSWPRSHPTGHFYFPGWHLKIELCLSLAPENDTSSGRTMTRPILGRAGLGGAQRYLEVCVFKTLKKFRINWVRYESSDCRSSRKSKALQMKWCWAFLAQSSDITPGGPRCALSLKSKGAPQVSFACSEDWLCNLQIPVQNEKWAPCQKFLRVSSWLCLFWTHPRTGHWDLPSLKPARTSSLDVGRAEDTFAVFCRIKNMVSHVYFFIQV